MSRAVLLACAGVLCGLFAPGLRAQARWELSFAATGAQEIARSRNGTARERLSGLVLGGDAVATRGPLIARVRYGQGRVTNDSAARDVVEGEALVGYRARPWLTVWFGPHARTFVVTGLSDRRWLLWSGRVTARGSLFPGRLESYVEFWQGVTGSLSRPAAAVTGGGAEGGLEMRLAQRPFWGRLAYRIEQARVAGGRRETVEAVTFSVGYALRPSP